MWNLHSKSSLSILAGTTALALTCLACPAQAAVATYTSSSAFLSAVGGSLQTETFEGLAVDTVLANGSGLNGLTYTFSGGLAGRIDSTYNRFGDRSLGAVLHSGADFFLNNESISVNFGGAVNAFGVFFNANQSPAGAWFVATDTGGMALSSALYDTPTFHFVGLVSDTPFNQVVFGGNGTGLSGFNVDNLSYNRSANRIPEPGALALASLLLLALGARTRRG